MKKLFSLLLLCGALAWAPSLFAITVTFSSVSNSSASTVTIGPPAGISDGCLLFASMSRNTTGGGSISPAPGFVAAVPEFNGSGTSKIAVFKKTAASETGSAYVFTGASFMAGNMIAICDPAGVSVDAVGTGQGGTGTTATALSVTTTHANDLVFFFSGSDGLGTSQGVPSGFTPTGTQDASNSVEGLASGYILQASPGASGNKTATTTSPWSAALVAVANVPPPPPPTIHTDCDYTTLAALVAAAATNPGTTIICNAGSWTWGSGQNLAITNQKLNLLGAGIDQTIITLNTGGNQPIAITTCDAQNYVRISGFTFKVQTAITGQVMITAGCVNNMGAPPVAFRVDHNKMIGDPVDGSDSSSISARQVFTQGVYGVVDHNDIWALTDKGFCAVNAGQDQDFGQSITNFSPLQKGSNKALYVEANDVRCTFVNQSNGFSDNYRGAKYVLRYNTILNNNSGHHGWDSGNQGVPLHEVYRNTYRLNDIRSNGQFVHVSRSGTGIMFQNTIQQDADVGTSFQLFYVPQYYAGQSPAETVTASISAWARATGIYPNPPWNGPWSGTLTVDDGHDNLMTGTNPIDGNHFGHNHMFSSRTVHDMVTTSGSGDVTSATAAVAFPADQLKFIIADNFTPGSVNPTCTWTMGGNAIACSGASFTAADTGKTCGAGDRRSIPIGTCTFVDSTHLTTNQTAINSTGGEFDLMDPYIDTVGVGGANHFHITGSATASQSGKTIVIGYSDQGWPGAQQPGTGAWQCPLDAAPNNWPFVTSGYDLACYFAQDPEIIAGNHWETNHSDWSVITKTDPPAVQPYYTSTIGLFQADREYRDQQPGDANQCALGDGIHGTGCGTLSQLMGASFWNSCTNGATFLVTDGGTWNQSGDGLGSAVIYTCSSNAWAKTYEPLVYPYPGTAGPVPSSKSYLGFFQ